MRGLELKNHFSLTSAIDIQSVCEPLKAIGISYFNYLKIYNNDGSRELLTNNAEWIDHFYKNALYDTVGAIDVEHLLPKGYFLWSELDENDPCYTQGRELFNIDHGLSFVMRRKDVTYLYIFASTRDNTAINNYYIRNIDLIRRFIYYFNDKALPLMKEAADNRIYLPNKQIISEDSLQRCALDNKLRQDFYNNTEIDRYFILSEADDLYVTKKQAECIAYMMEGATAKETAYKMNISYRTVEGYIEDVKTKIPAQTGTRCNKDDLMKIFKHSGISEVILCS